MFQASMFQASRVRQGGTEVIAYPVLVNTAVEEISRRARTQRGISSQEAEALLAAGKWRVLQFTSLPQGVDVSCFPLVMSELHWHVHRDVLALGYPGHNVGQGELACPPEVLPVVKEAFWRKAQAMGYAIHVTQKSHVGRRVLLDATWREFQSCFPEQPGSERRVAREFLSQAANAMRFVEPGTTGLIALPAVWNGYAKAVNAALVKGESENVEAIMAWRSAFSALTAEEIRVVEQPYNPEDPRHTPDRIFVRPVGPWMYKTARWTETRVVSGDVPAKIVTFDAVKGVTIPQDQDVIAVMDDGREIPIQLGFDIRAVQSKKATRMVNHMRRTGGWATVYRRIGQRREFMFRTLVGEVLVVRTPIYGRPDHDVSITWDMARHHDLPSQVRPDAEEIKLFNYLQRLAKEFVTQPQDDCDYPEAGYPDEV